MASFGINHLATRMANTSLTDGTLALTHEQALEAAIKRYRAGLIEMKAIWHELSTTYCTLSPKCRLCEDVDVSLRDLCYKAFVDDDCWWWENARPKSWEHSQASSTFDFATDFIDKMEQILQVGGDLYVCEEFDGGALSVLDEIQGYMGELREAVDAHLAVADGIKCAGLLKYISIDGQQHKSPEQDLADIIQQYPAYIEQKKSKFHDMRAAYCGLKPAQRGTEQVDKPSRLACDYAFLHNECFWYDEVARPKMWEETGVYIQVMSVMRYAEMVMAELEKGRSAEDCEVLHEFATEALNKIEAYMIDLGKALDKHLEMARCGELAKMSMEEDPGLVASDELARLCVQDEEVT